MSRLLNYAAFATVLFVTACAKEPASASVPDHLILLTKTDDSNTEASFLAVDNLEHCETRASGARAVFPAAGITYIAHYCVKSEPVFEPFAHSSDENARTYVFDLNLSKDGTALSSATPYASVKACANAKGRLCIVTTQNKVTR